MSTTRRGMIEAAGGAGLLAIAAVCFSKPDAAHGAPHDLDADLIRLCQQARSTHTAEKAATDVYSEMRFADPGYADAKARSTSLSGALDEQIEAICDIVPQTPAGHAAMASLALFIMHTYRPLDPDQYPDDSLGYVPEPLVETILHNLRASA
jgi:hypothetical protein